ncbi:MAG: SAM-dependent methyltransferase [Planctomycetes bacterium]|nr:SAM-dependent methyltransferase [Planctomycetota bacterium]
MQPLTLAACDFLSSPAAQAELAGARLPAKSEELGFLSRARARFGADEAGWLLDQLQLRARARGRIPDAERLLFDPEALSMLSSAPVAAWRALRLKGLAGSCLDLGAGGGGDCMAFARAGLAVQAVERDPVRARLLEHNLELLGLADRVRVLVLDWTTRAWNGEELAFVDPARRVDGARVLSLHDTLPPLQTVLDLAQEVPAVLLKAAPGFALRELPAQAGLEFVSLDGELKEALLTFGRARRSGPRAVILPAGAELEGEPPAEPTLGPPGEWIYEPDPAVIRAGLVRLLGARLGAHQLDAQTAYLSGPAAAAAPFARAWRVERWGHFLLKGLKRWLREADVGTLEVKRRRSPIEPATLLRQLGKLRGARKATVFLTPVEDRPSMVLAFAEEA